MKKASIILAFILIITIVVEVSAQSVENYETKTWHPAEEYYYSDHYGSTECDKDFIANWVDILSSTQYMTTTVQAGYYEGNNPNDKVYNTDTGSQAYAHYSYNKTDVWDEWTYQYKNSY